MKQLWTIVVCWPLRPSHLARDLTWDAVLWFMNHANPELDPDFKIYGQGEGKSYTIEALDKLVNLDETPVAKGGIPSIGGSHSIWFHEPGLVQFEDLIQVCILPDVLIKRAVQDIVELGYIIYATGPNHPPG